MNERKLSATILADYDRWLRQEERADATREKYLRSIRAFAAWLGGAAVTKDAVTEWKSQLVERRQAPSTINTALAAHRSASWRTRSMPVCSPPQKIPAMRGLHC